MKCQICGTEYNSRFCPKGCNSPYYQKQKKKGKKIAIIIISIFVFAATMGILFGEETPTDSTSTPTAASTQDESSKTKETEKLVYSDSNVKVSFIKVADASDYGVGVTACYIYLKVENVGSQTYTVSLAEAYANDSAVTVMSGVPMTLAPGKNSKQPFMFGYNNILTSADDVEKLEFKIMLLDENLSVIETTKNITIDVK